jgi:hypothetical protein
VWKGSRARLPRARKQKEGIAVSAAVKTVPALPPGVKEKAARGTAPLVTVPPEAAQEAGLRCRVLVDAGVWDDCVTWTDQDSARKGITLDEGARQDDLLYPAACALQRDSAEGSGAGRPGALPFTVERVPRTGPGREAHKVTLTVTAARGPRGITVTIAPAPAPAGYGAAEGGAR